MFGHDWQAGQGTVVDIVYGGAAVHGNDRAAISQRFLIDVRPSSGEPFRCEVSGLLRDTFRTPDMGDVVQLKCDPGARRRSSSLLTRWSTRRLTPRSSGSNARPTSHAMTPSMVATGSRRLRRARRFVTLIKASEP